MKKLCFILLLIPAFGYSQIDRPLQEKANDQLATSKGFLVFGTFLCTVPVALLKDGSEEPEAGLFLLGAASIATGVVLNSVGYNIMKKSKLSITPTGVTYRF